MENPNIEIRFKGEGPSEECFIRPNLGHETINFKLMDRVTGDYMRIYLSKETTKALINELNRLVDLYNSFYEEE